MQSSKLFSNSFIFIFLLLFSKTANSGVKPLVKLKRSDTSEVTKLALVTNDLGEIQKLKIKKPDDTTYIRPRKLKGKGTAILKKMGVKIIVLKSSNFDVKLGGIPMPQKGPLERDVSS